MHLLALPFDMMLDLSRFLEPDKFVQNIQMHAFVIFGSKIQIG